MDSQFRNSSLGFYLYAVIIFIIAAASIFVFWYMVIGYKLGTYPEDTILGNVYIGGLEENDVEARMVERIDRWLGDNTIVFEVTYQGYSYEFNRELFYFDYSTSIFFIAEGETNELVVTYQGDDRQEIINEIEASDFLEKVDVDNFDIEQIIVDVLKDASLMKSFSSKRLEDYIIDDDVAYGELGTIDLVIPEDIIIDDMITNIDLIYSDSRILVNSKELFDIVEKFNSSLSDDEMSILSGGMLALILETNFSINEVHYIPTIDYVNYSINTFPYFGHNSSVNQIIGDSFSFYNPNNSEYYFTLTKIDESTAKLTLNGLEFIDDISVLVNKTPIEYITQTTTNSNIIQNGYNGMIVEVVRTIKNIDGIVKYEKVIVFEFYPPIKEIALEH